MPGSVVGSVVHHEEEEDVEYDPLYPAEGSVASVVRVTERKYVIYHLKMIYCFHGKMICRFVILNLMLFSQLPYFTKYLSVSL